MKYFTPSTGHILDAARIAKSLAKLDNESLCKLTFNNIDILVHAESREEDISRIYLLEKMLSRR